MTRSSRTPVSQATLRLSGPAALLDALPRMLGYHPSESVVLIALHRPRGKVAVTMRLDLPPLGDEEACAEMLAEHALQHGAESAVLLRYEQAAGGSRGVRADPSGAGPPLVAAVRDALRRRDISLTDALIVASGRWRSDLCEDATCCPPEGTPLCADETSVVAAALVAEGCRALPDRQAVVRSVAAPTSVRRVVVEQALDAAAAELAERVSAGESGEALRRETIALFDVALARYPQCPALAMGEAVRLVVGMGDIEARDQVLSLAARPDSGALLSLLMDLTRHAVPPADAPVATALAWVAYSRGDGTLANVALDRALTSDPDYSMARLIRDGLGQGIHPRQVREISEAFGCADRTGER